MEAPGIDVAEDTDTAPTETVAGSTAKKVAELDEDTVFTPEEVGGIVGGVFDLAASQLGEHWRLDEAEKRSIGRPLAKVLNKHWDGIGRYSEEAALAVACALILGGKLQEHREQVDVDL